SEDSTVTYTAVSSLFEDGSDIGSPGVDGLPIILEDPYAYIMVAYQVPPSPDYIPEPEEPEEEDEDPEEDLADYPADRDDDDEEDEEDEDEDEDEEEEEEHPAPADSVPPVHRMT
ncbi:hypothetical protein Tco_0430347, partial [Tanacetum coccineum]